MISNDDDVSTDELREAVEHMHGVPARFILSALAVAVASGCKSSDCGKPCPCPSPFQGPGWYSTTGPGPCCCPESTLCPG
ncbi:MAG: hypothetical protein ACLP1X_14825 [Polyangiaceae bacterium]